MTYIQKQIRFWNAEAALPNSYKTGTTIEDYDNGAFLLLSSEQVAFHEAHPEASPIECWNMEIPSSPEPEPVPEPDALVIARQENSSYSITLPALQSDGETKTKLWTTGTPPQSIEVPISWAMEKLPLLEIYAKRTYDRRASNEAATYAATTVEEIQAINVKADYPNFLTFELNLDL